MKMTLKTALAAMLLVAVPLVLAQDAATDVKKGADKTGHDNQSRGQGHRQRHGEGGR